MHILHVCLEVGIPGERCGFAAIGPALEQSVVGLGEPSPRAVFLKLADPLWIIVITVLILGSDIVVAFVRFSVGISQM